MDKRPKILLAALTVKGLNAGNCNTGTCNISIMALGSCQYENLKMRPSLMLEAWCMGMVLVHITTAQKSPSHFLVSSLLRKEHSHKDPLLNVKVLSSSEPEVMPSLPCRYHAGLGQAASAHAAMKASSVRVTAYQPFDIVERRLYVHMHV